MPLKWKPRADIYWAFQPEEGVYSFQNVNQLKQHVVLYIALSAYFESLLP